MESSLALAKFLGIFLIITEYSNLPVPRQSYCTQPARTPGSASYYIPRETRAQDIAREFHRILDYLTNSKV